MITTYINNLQLIACTTMLFMGHYLAWGSVPIKEELLQYRKSRKLIGISFLIISLQFFLQWFFKARGELTHIASALNITFFSFSGTLLAYSYISMLDKHFITKKQIIKDTIICSSIFIMVWGSIALFPFDIFIKIQKFSAVLLLIYISKMCLDFIITYRKAVKKINNYYSDNIGLFITWMSKSIFLKIATGILIPILAFYTEWNILIYLIINLILYYYIFCSFINYLPNSEAIDNAVTSNNDDIEDNEIVEIKQSLDNRTETINELLNNWVNDKRYLMPGLTINTLSSDLKINKTYLSSYINNNLNITFRDWINNLRIEHAKQIINEYPDKTNDEIAENSGYSSRSHFIKVFTDIVGESPSSWKKNNNIVS